MARSLGSVGQTAVRAALDEFDLIGREAFLEKYGFGLARDFLVRHPSSGTWADSKAIVGAAYGYQFPDRGPLRAVDFSGGQATVVRLLTSLGFSVTASEGGGPGALRPQRSTDWLEHEVELVVADYLHMLALELAGQTYNKASRRKALVPLLNGRTEASIEFKRRNISAVLLALGFPYLRGYLPATNAQRMLSEVVESQISKASGLDSVASAAVETPAADPDIDSFADAKTLPPSPPKRQSKEEPQPYFRAVKRDYLEREARNRSLGHAGERFVLRYEQWRLASEGLGQLADRVRHVSLTEGDGLGYDILSFDRHGQERFLEVKTTAFGEVTPFFISATEVRLARAEPEKFSLCRVFDFRAAPKFFELPGLVEQHCTLDPTTYRATLH